MSLLSHRPGAYQPRPPHARSPAADRAIAEAVIRTQEAHDTGQLLTPSEALALAGPEARSKETLFSIAREVGWRHDVEVEEILDVLAERFFEFR